MRGEVFRLLAPRGVRGHEQSGSRFAGSRFAVVVQSDQLPLSTWLVAPTSTSARAASFRPSIEVVGTTTLVLAEQTAAVDPRRLGESVGFLSLDEMRRVDAALRIVMDL
ncbi:MAG: type II toxin-antitoxin system PemK/MazF family toxin [Dietzia sp.]|nr:type II toxin-antitoxin system PemK/MazF family toxin [Dietzia sp.]